MADRGERREAARRYLSGLGLPPAEVTVLATLASEGDPERRQGQELSAWAATKVTAGARAGCAGNTWLRAARRLEARGLVAIVRVTEPWTYVANWSRVARLAAPPTDPLDDLPLLQPIPPDWKPPPVHAGPPRSTPVQGPCIREPCIQNPCSVDPCIRDSVRTGPVDRSGPGDGDRWRRPWSRQGGISPEDLRGAVARGDWAALRALYLAAVDKGWIRRTEDAGLRFLTACHHAATCRGINSPVGVLIERVKAGLDVSRIPHASEQWAQEFMAANRAAPASPIPEPREVPCA